MCSTSSMQGTRWYLFISTRIVAVCCSVLQCVAVCCSVLQCVAVFIAHFTLGSNTYSGVFLTQDVATHCNTLQHTATHCSHCNTFIRMHTYVGMCLTQYIVIHYNTLQHTATHCNAHYNTMEPNVKCAIETATHCNTLQHTATHWNLTWHVQYR